MITASICTIGDEILIGQIVDTNSSMIASALNSIGVKVNEMISAPDDGPRMREALERCLRTSDIAIVTGGLGPTKDDITKKALAELSGSVSSYRSEPQLAVIRRILSARGIELSDINLEQASVPDTCRVIVNECGTAPCMQFEFPAERYGHPCMLFSLPGVPFEAEAALPKVLAAIRERFPLTEILHKTLCTFGIPESTLARRIAAWEDALPARIHLAYLPNPTLGVRLRLSIYGTGREEGERELERYLLSLQPLLGNALYGEEGDSLQSMVGALLKNAGKTISVAESCTGGMLASLLTSVPGSSAYFYGGVVSYDNRIKAGVLKVKPETLERFGAVSRACVEEMARGVRELMDTDYAIATSGIAGPGGGTPDKPVGTVWIAAASRERTVSAQFRFSGSRKLNMERSAANALNLFRTEILGHAPQIRPFARINMPEDPGEE